MTKELVVASYNEDLSWLRYLPKDWSVVAYNTATTQRDFPEGVKVVPLPNIGREAGQFAFHLANNYGDLADFTAFIQADREHDPERIDALLSSDLPARDFGYIGGGAPDDLKALPGFPSHCGAFFRQLWGDLPVPAPTPFRVGGQFFVRKAAVHRLPQTHYARLLELIRAHRHTYPAGSAAHILEAYWACIFQP